MTWLPFLTRREKQKGSPSVNPSLAFITEIQKGTALCKVQDHYGKVKLMYYNVNINTAVMTSQLELDVKRRTNHSWTV